MKFPLKYEWGELYPIIQVLMNYVCFIHFYYDKKNFLVRVLRINYGNLSQLEQTWRSEGDFLIKCVPTGNAIIIFESIVSQFMCF